MAQKILVNGYLLFAISFLIQGCIRTLIIDEIQDGAGDAVDVTLIPNATPVIEPVRRAGNSNPYSVFGVTYRLLPSAEGYRERGTASWYGKKFHGRRTANGDVYNMYGMTAAHRTLPIPAYARVTNLDNQRSVIVRINDRGPFHSERIIDLSYVAALKLGFAERGTTQVEVEVITPPAARDNALPEGSEKTAARKTPSLPHVPLPVDGAYLQVGAFTTPDAASTLRAQLETMTDLSVAVKQQKQLYKVTIGPVMTLQQLTALQERLRSQLNMSSFVLWP